MPVSKYGNASANGEYTMSILIRNGTIFDGVKPTPFQADIYIQNGRIEQVGTALPMQATREIRADGMVVTPGFIDIHRHMDLAVLRPGFGTAELAQGITTVVGGNCGLSPVPMCTQHAAEANAFLSPCLGPPASCMFEQFREYITAARAMHLRLNMGMLSAVGAIRIYVKGFASGPFTASEMEQARSLLTEALQDGALGISLGVMYAPECHTSIDEYIELLRAAAPYGRPMCCHIRGEGASLAESVAEILTIAKRAGLPAHISHFKSVGVKHWQHELARAIELIDAAHAGGQDVTVDFYPYTAGASTLVSLVPPEMLMDNRSALWKALESPSGKARMRHALYGKQIDPSWDNMVRDIGWERIVLTNAGSLPNVSGLDFVSVAREMGVEDPADAMCEVLSQTQGEAGIVIHSMCQDDVETVVRLPYAFLISDALYGGAAHPRQSGAFPRFLRQFVPGVLPMGEAIRKMTSMPADRLALWNRGRIAPGYRADIALFDSKGFLDTATYAEPDRMAQGMIHVLVNGETAWYNGHPTTNHPGQLIVHTIEGGISNGRLS